MFCNISNNGKLNAYYIWIKQVVKHKNSSCKGCGYIVLMTSYYRSTIVSLILALDLGQSCAYYIYLWVRKGLGKNKKKSKYNANTITFSYVSVFRFHCAPTLTSQGLPPEPHLLQDMNFWLTRKSRENQNSHLTMWFLFK